jgi:putative zinc finger/helix-turn-helix YgiT family protein
MTQNRNTTNATRQRRERPFPWRCSNCHKEEVYPATIPYAADIKHDGRLHHIEVHELKIPKCKTCGEVVFNYEADDQMLQALRSHLRLLTPEQIKGGRKALRLKSKDLAERLGIAAATVSRWEKGMMIQSRAMDNLLRVYFAVPETRAVLRGKDQNPYLGVAAARDETPTPPEPTNNPVWGKFAHLKDLTGQRERAPRFHQHGFAGRN